MIPFRIAFFLCSAFLFFSCESERPEKDYTTWGVYGGPDNIHYSSLTQIDTSNVDQLTVAWEYHTGDADSINKSQIQCNPIMVDGILYGTTPRMKLFALDAATGEEKWQFNPFDSLRTNRGFFVMNNSRGVAHWTDGTDHHIFYTAGPFVYCVDAKTGKSVSTFGQDGSIDLHKDLGRKVSTLFVTATSPGIIYKDLIIMGSRVDEGPAAAPGHIRAYDVRTGKLRWIFHTIPQPGEFGYETWDDSTAYRFIGGANVWSGFSLDEERGIVFASTGSASFDFYGGKRTGDNLFANCMLALNADTGERIWHFQQIRHDVWDRDFPCPPALVTIEKDGRQIDAVAQTTKTGFVFVLDRETGEPVYPIEEREVPTDTDLQGEILSPTQPYPTKPAAFVRQSITEGDLNNLVPDSSYQDIRARFATFKNGHMFNPPSRQGTLILPGFDGGAEWGGPSFDPETGILYVNANEMAWVLTIVDVEEPPVVEENFLQAGHRLYELNCMVCHGADLKGTGNNPGLIGMEAKYTPGSFDTLLVTGRRMMPALGHIREKDRQAIATFVLNLTDQQDRIYTAPGEVQEDPTKVPYTITGYNKFLTKEGYPAISPPWGTLNAIDLNTGELVWKKTLGEYPEFKAKGIETGTENYGGSIVTAGGLVFIAATRDSKFRAFNKMNGKLLWEYDLPASGFATPAMYEMNGKQYIVIACGGGKLQTESGDSYVAFALP